jgi:uncharacterized membrane protein YhaH (DUF805 family)
MEATGVRGRYGRSLLVAIGWYATVVAAAIVANLSVPEEPQQDCSAMFSCLSPFGEIMLAALWAVPVLLGMLIVTSIVNALVVRRVESAILAGTLSVAITVSLAVLVAGAYLANA